MVDEVCAKCYRVKELAPVHKDASALLVCVRCRWDVEETLGFLSHNGIDVTLSRPLNSHAEGNENSSGA